MEKCTCGSPRDRSQSGHVPFLPLKARRLFLGDGLAGSSPLLDIALIWVLHCFRGLLGFECARSMLESRVFDSAWEAMFRPLTTEKRLKVAGFIPRCRP